MPAGKPRRRLLSPQALEAEGLSVEAYDFANPNLLPRQTVGALTGIWEEAARDIARLLVERELPSPLVHLQGIQCLRAESLAETLTAPTMAALLSTAPVEGIGLLQMDLPVAFALLNHLLGGGETKEVPPRGLSAIEHAVLEELVDAMLDCVRSAWEPVCRLEFTVTQRTDAVETLHFSDPRDWLLVVRFRLESGRADGDIRLALPAGITDHVSRSEAQGAASSRRARRGAPLSLLGEVTAKFTAQLGPVGVSLSTLSGLAAGDVLLLGPREEHPVCLVSGERYRMCGRLVAEGRRLGVQIARRPGAKGG